MCPIDRRLIEPALLTDFERKYLNDYHATVRRVCRPRSRARR
ncbi:MAG: M24 family metallopeptidase C-terminal domain-containing protein [bacterium]|nr:M24 family metallopeptidase C-terminal domain-containing protein [bacterium]